MGKTNQWLLGRAAGLPGEGKAVGRWPRANMSAREARGSFIKVPHPEYILSAETFRFQFLAKFLALFPLI